MTQLLVIVTVLFGPFFGLLICTGDLVRKIIGWNGPDWSSGIPYFFVHSIPLFVLLSMPSVPACYAAVGQETTLGIPVITIASGIIILIVGGAIVHVFNRLGAHETALAVHEKELERLTRIEDKLDQLTTLVRNGH